MKNLIQYDETEFQDSFPTWGLTWIAELYGPDVAALLDPEVVHIDVGSHRVAV